MAFRADEAARNGTERVLNYLVPKPKEATEAERARSREAVLDLIEEKLGPAIDTYPSWHPLVSNNNCRSPQTLPSDRNGYKGLDHTRCFANGFITCPYDGGQKVIDSVDALPYHPAAFIKAEKLDVPLYHPAATPILVKCQWNEPLLNDGTIPLFVAMPLLLEQEIPCWRKSEVAETWETMRHYFLGSPHGSRSSLFVNQETGQAMKKVWNALIYTGMFGPIKVGSDY
jgi:hypothetical protein